MARLKSRDKFIPNGFKFFQPETGWSAPRMESFSSIVGALVAHRMGNPFLAQKNGWATDPVAVADEVDFYNAAICEKMGWTDYISGDLGAPPKTLPSQSNPFGPLRAVPAGAISLAELFGPSEIPVSLELAEKRAKVCSTCPQNKGGDWTRFFTKPASELVRHALALVKGRNLVTSLDGELAICSACHCPMKLKVWSPIDHIRSHLSDENKADLDPSCWIPRE